MNNNDVVVCSFENNGALILFEFVGNNQVVVQALQSRIIGTFWSILASPLVGGGNNQEKPYNCKTKFSSTIETEKAWCTLNITTFPLRLTLKSLMTLVP